MYCSEFRLIFLKWDRWTWKHVIAMKHGHFYWIISCSWLQFSMYPVISNNYHMVSAELKSLLKFNINLKSAWWYSHSDERFHGDTVVTWEISRKWQNSKEKFELSFEISNNVDKSDLIMTKSLIYLMCYWQCVRQWSTEYISLLSLQC